MLNSCRLDAGEWWSLLWSIVEVGGDGDGSVTVIHLGVRYGDRADGSDVWATPTAQSAVGEPAANVPRSGNTETAVSGSDGKSHQSWRSASGQDDVRCP